VWQPRNRFNSPHYPHCDRWCNQLNPTVKRGPFTEEEDQQILAAHAVHGNKWAVISRSIPGRYAATPRRVGVPFSNAPARPRQRDRRYRFSHLLDLIFRRSQSQSVCPYGPEYSLRQVSIFSLRE
jgi:hypothetical protein